THKPYPQTIPTNHTHKPYPQTIPTNHTHKPNQAIFISANTTPLKNRFVFHVNNYENVPRAVASFFASVWPPPSSDIIWLTRH
ncbi:MAG: hypothetical protein ACT6FF_07045, partial [Methanosarcinaceae archaeon]